MTMVDLSAVDGRQRALTTSPRTCSSEKQRCCARLHLCNHTTASATPTTTPVSPLLTSHAAWSHRPGSPGGPWRHEAWHSWSRPTRHWAPTPWTTCHARGTWGPTHRPWRPTHDAPHGPTHGSRGARGAHAGGPRAHGHATWHLLLLHGGWLLHGLQWLLHAGLLLLLLLHGWRLHNWPAVGCGGTHGPRATRHTCSAQAQNMVCDILCYCLQADTHCILAFLQCCLPAAAFACIPTTQAPHVNAPAAGGRMPPGIAPGIAPGMAPGTGAPMLPGGEGPGGPRGKPPVCWWGASIQDRRQGSL
jgi:hypothetical protein